MLKIKDEYNLEILKNFGFEYDYGTSYVKKFKDREGREDTYIEISDCDLKELNFIIGSSLFGIDDTINDIAETIYDLIKADLVEKIV